MISIGMMLRIGPLVSLWCVMMCCDVLLEPDCHAGASTTLTASAHIDWLASFRGWLQHCQLHCLRPGRMMMPKKQTDWLQSPRMTAYHISVCQVKTFWIHLIIHINLAILSVSPDPNGWCHSAKYAALSICQIKIRVSAGGADGMGSD